MIGLSALTLPTPATATAAAAAQQPQEQPCPGSPPRQKQPANSLTMLKRHQLQEAAFVPMQACEVEWQLPGGVPLLLVPCTYAPGVKGGFKLSVSTSGFSFKCDPVPGGLSALLAASGTQVTRVTQH
jgi:hypothetical protein